ncbi:MAG: EAL domain-containing protein [Clostridia bacterium]|nr:EAL domain-containing protein [Clostridia bacterium]
MSLGFKLKGKQYVFNYKRCCQVLLVGILICLCSVLALYYNLFLNQYFFYGVFFCLPITLAGFWYGKKAGLSTALLFSGLVIINSVVGMYKYLNNDLLQIVTFLLVGYIVGLLREKNRYSEKIIEYQAYHDLLTGLPNRLKFEDLLRNELEIAKAEKEMLAIYLVDLDKFKYINDILGHLAGDKLLVQVSQRLKNAFKEDAVIARSAGDEFLVFMPRISGKQEIIDIAMRIIDCFKERFIIQEREIYLTISIGISVFPVHGDNAKSLISYADIAVNKVKEVGRNAYRFFNMDMDKDISDRVHIANKMRQVIDEKNFNVFELHYQPMVEVISGKIVAVEALLRWNHPEEGLLYPHRFIQVAEETGLIVPIGKWVLQTACGQIKEWQEKFHPSLKLAVNISEQQLRDKDFFSDVLYVLTETKFEPNCLELEITETIAMNNSGRNIEVLNELRKMGVRVALDDFGTGYSSLNYLGTLPINLLKVDYHLVKEIPFNIKNSAIATSIISLASCLDYEVVAEGVETNAQLIFFQQNKCTYIQGFLFSKPLPPEELEVLLQEKNEVAFIVNKD